MINGYRLYYSFWGFFMCMHKDKYNTKSQFFSRNFYGCMHSIKNSYYYLHFHGIYVLRTLYVYFILFKHLGFFFLHIIMKACGSRILSFLLFKILIFAFHFQFSKHDHLKSQRIATQPTDDRSRSCTRRLGREHQLAAHPRRRWQ